MSKYDEQMKRWDAILGDDFEGTQEDGLKIFFKHLKSNLQLPCEVSRLVPAMDSMPRHREGKGIAEKRRLKSRP